MTILNLTYVTYCSLVPPNFVNQSGLLRIWTLQSRIPLPSEVAVYISSCYRLFSHEYTFLGAVGLIICSHVGAITGIMWIENVHRRLTVYPLSQPSPKDTERKYLLTSLEVTPIHTVTVLDLIFILTWVFTRGTAQQYNSQWIHIMITSSVSAALQTARWSNFKAKLFLHLKY